MPIDFFQKERHKLQDRFNQTFGQLIVCNIKTRYRVLLAIISLGLLERKISETHEREDIKQFVRTRDSLNKFFDYFEEVKNVERTNKRKNTSNTKTLRNRACSVAG